MTDVRIPVLSHDFGTFDAEGNYTPRAIVDDDLGDADLEQAMGDSIIEFDVESATLFQSRYCCRISESGCSP